ncbi:MAG: hypothetical protein KAT15_31725, partial [Bacteroidales bacterium]|nr:hypothetical protein [Bacteroidales bacterium]
MKRREILLSIIIFIPGCIFFACQSKNKPSSTTEKSPESVLLPETDHYYQEIIRHSGIDFTHTIGDDHLSNLVESVGGGAAFLDYDQ